MKLFETNCVWYLLSHTSLRVKQSNTKGILRNRNVILRKTKVKLSNKYVIAIEENKSNIELYKSNTE